MSDIKFWRYSLPTVDGWEGWGVFLLDSTGMFCCVSDYGNYAYKWTHHGKDDFRELFVKDHFGYHVDKLFNETGQKKEFQVGETIDKIKSSILHSRFEEYIDEEEARKEWDLVESIDWTFGEVAQWEWYQETSLYDADEYFVYDYPASVKALRDKLLPRLAVVIKQDLKGEKYGETKTDID